MIPLPTRVAALRALVARVQAAGPEGLVCPPPPLASPDTADLDTPARLLARGLGQVVEGVRGRQRVLLDPRYVERPAPERPDLPSACNACRLWATTGAYCVPGTGDWQSPLLLVGEALGEQEERQRRPFVGRAGDLLVRALAAAGLRREEVWMTNAVRCRPTTSAGRNRTPTAAERDACQFFLLNEVHAMPKLQVAVALGATAATALLGEHLPPGGIMEHQGRVLWSALLHAWVVITVHPAYALRRPGELWTLTQDLLLAQRIAAQGRPAAPTTARYRLVQTEAQVHEMRDALLAARRRVTFDWETNGLHPVYARGICVSFCVDEADWAWVLPLVGQELSPLWARDVYPQVLQALRAVFDSQIPWVGQHVAFDSNITRSTVGVRPRRVIGDTLLKHQVIWNHLPERAHGLKRLSVLYTGYGRYDDAVDQWLLAQGYKDARGRPDMGHLWRAPNELVWPYNATDSVVTARVDDALDAPLDAAGLRRVYEQERVPMAVDYAEHDRTGLRLNTTRLDQFGRDLAVASDLIDRRLTSLVGYPLNLGSAQQVQRYLFTEQQYPVMAFTETGQPSTREEHLLELARLVDDPALHLILHGRGYRKLQGTYVEGRADKPGGFRAALDPDGRVRPDTLLHVVETFRLATRRPLALHTIPRPLVMWTCETGGHGHYLFEPCGCEDATRLVLNLRSLIEPDPGYVFVIGDSVQQEFCLLAIASHQADLEAALCDRGEDAHEFTMRLLTGRTRASYEGSKAGEAEYKNARTMIKSVNFAMLYLGQAKTLVRTLARGTPPVLVTEEMAQETIETFYQRLPMIRSWQRDKCAEVQRTGRSMSLFGDTYRVLPQAASSDLFDRFAAERMGVNFPIQEGGFRVMARAKIRLTREWAASGFPARVAFTVHDEIVAQVPERADLIAQTVADMRAAMEQVHPELVGGCGIPRGIRADIKVAANWGGEPVITRTAAPGALVGSGSTL